MGKKKSFMHIDDANQAGALLRTAHGGGQGGALLEIGGFSYSPTRSANTIMGNDYPHMQRGIETRRLIKDDADYTNYTGGKIQENELAELPSKTVIPHDPAVGGGNGGEGNKGGVPETQSGELGVLRGDAYQHMLDVINKKFSYNAKSSPLYGILREQYEREAERASGRAYARATANAGGYGSSYATLAGEEAARQVMEGFDDNQMALYEAARDEFYSEQQSAVERYQLLDQMYKEQKALEEEEAAELARSAAGGLTETQTEIVDIIYNSRAADLGDTNIRKQLTTAYGYSEADVDAAFNAIRGFEKAQIQDEVGAWKKNPTLEGATALAEMTKNVDGEDSVTEIQEGIGETFLEAVKDPRNAFALMGEEESAWKNKTESEQIDAICSAAMGLWKQGGLSDHTYTEILSFELRSDLEYIDHEISGDLDQQDALIDLIVGLTEREKRGDIPTGREEDGVFYSKYYFDIIVQSNTYQKQKNTLHDNYEKMLWAENVGLDALGVFERFEYGSAEHKALIRLVTFDS